MQAAIATPNTMEMISLSPATPVPASQRISTSSDGDAGRDQHAEHADRRQRPHAALEPTLGLIEKMHGRWLCGDLGQPAILPAAPSACVHAA